MSYSALLSSYQMRDLQLKNRVVMAPMTRARAGKERIPNALMAEYYGQRCGAGLIITEATTISRQANGWVESPGIYSDAMAAGWKKIVEQVHAKGSRIFLQLWHMGRASHSSFHDGQLAVAPSAIAINAEYIHTPIGKQPHEVPRALELAEIPQVVDDYRRAAELARWAGFDGVEVHGANGYLIDQFLQSKTNHRTDSYGGSIEKRYRFLKDVLAAVTTVFPAERVGVRISPNGAFNDMGSPEYREAFLYVAQQLDSLGLAYLHVMDGLAFGFHQLGTPMTLPEFRSVFSATLMGNCGYTAEHADQTIARTDVDLVSFGRPFISNPDLVERWAKGWPLSAEAPIESWYSPNGARGYTDFAAYQPQ
jgi:N-ethylmaleimide reductase